MGGRMVKSRQGLEHLRKQQVVRWQEPRCINKRGRKRTSDDFYLAVLSELIFVDWNTVNGAQSLHQKANIAFSYDQIILAAKRTQNLPQF